MAANSPFILSLSKDAVLSVVPAEAGTQLWVALTPRHFLPVHPELVEGRTPLTPNHSRQPVAQLPSNVLPSQSGGNRRLEHP